MLLLCLRLNKNRILIHLLHFKFLIFSLLLNFVMFSRDFKFLLISQRHFLLIILVKITVLFNWMFWLITRTDKITILRSRTYKLIRWQRRTCKIIHDRIIRLESDSILLHQLSIRSMSDTNSLIKWRYLSSGWLINLLKILLR